MLFPFLSRPFAVARLAVTGFRGAFFHIRPMVFVFVTKHLTFYCPVRVVGIKLLGRHYASQFTHICHSAMFCYRLSLTSYTWFVLAFSAFLFFFATTPFFLFPKIRNK